MTERVGMYAVQTDHPGLMKSIKKKKTTKKDRSQFANDDDAKKDHIVGQVHPNGKIVEKINKRLENIDG